MNKKILNQSTVEIVCQYFRDIDKRIFTLNMNERAIFKILKRVDFP